MNTSRLTRAVYGFRSDREPFDGKSHKEMAEQLLAWGCNAVFLRDEPEELLREFHSHGVKSYREIGVFQGCALWEEHPESRPIQADGSPLEKEEWYCGVCPNQGWLREEKLEEISRIVETTSVDGVWLDFIRYPVHWESVRPRLPQTCFCPVCLEKYVADSGIKLPTAESVAQTASYILENHRESWYQWRARQVTEFVKEAAAIAKAKKPDILVGLFAVPTREGRQDEALREVAGQDFAGLAAYVDVFSPMVYHRMCGQPPGWIAEVTEQMTRETRKPVWPIIQGCSVPDDLSDTEFQEAIAQAQLEPSQGVIVFALNHLVKEKRLGTLAEVWQHPAHKP